jgi:hypothetical protein
MKHNQDITEPIVAGDYVQITAPIYTDNTDTTVEQSLATGIVVWHLKGVHGIDLISKTSVGGGGITLNSPTTGSITIEVLGTNTATLTSGDYYHICEYTPNGGSKRGVFDGVASIDNRAGGD